MKSYIEATRDALAEELADDDDVVILGRDIGTSGGTFRSSSGLVDVFGAHRVRNFPPSDHLLMGAAIGLAVAGRRPVIDLTPTQELAGGIAHLLHAAAAESLTSGELSVPLTLRLVTGYGLGTGPDQAGDLHSLWCAAPGFDVVAPSNPAEAKGMLKSAIRSDAPCILLEDRSLFESRADVSSDEDFLQPLRGARIVKDGKLATVVAWGAAVGWAREAAAKLHEDGKSVEVIDLRTLSSLDVKTVGESLVRTGRCLIVEPSLAACSVGADLASRLQELCFDHLDAPIARLNTSPSVGYSPSLESSGIPTADDIVQALWSWLWN